MKPLSETYKELGIAFSFPIEIKDDDGLETYYETRYGYWARFERDANGYVTYREDINDVWCRCEYDNGNRTYYEDSDGIKEGTPRSAKTCEGKVVEVDGIKYELKAL